MTKCRNVYDSRQSAFYPGALRPPPLEVFFLGRLYAGKAPSDFPVNFVIFKRCGRFSDDSGIMETTGEKYRKRQKN